MTSDPKHNNNIDIMTDTCANPLLLGWIKEWLDQARERNSKGVTVYVYS